MKCPQCSFENPTGMKFCGECGAKLVVICPACQFQNPPGHKFCGECGAKLESAVVPPPVSPPTPPPLPELRPIIAAPKVEESKRKIVTILFADVSGFTAMSERLDHEEVNAIMRSCWQRLDGIIIHYGGTVDKHVGDAVMATFGADRTHEDDPIRAVKAGAAMQQSLREFGAALEGSIGVTLRMRIGINVGEVTVGEVAESTGERSVIGPAVNLASRLEHNARVGTVLVSDEIHRLTGWLFEYLALEPMDIKGIEGKVSTFELGGEKAVPDRDRGIAGIETELVGREKEVQVLGECLARLEAGQGTVLCLIGEAGVGKSRLTSEFRGRAALAGARWFAGRCFSYEANIPFGLLIDVLRSVFDVARGSSEAEIVESIREQLWTLVADEEEREEKAAFIASLFSVRIPNHFVDGLDAKLRHDLTMAAVKNVFLASARKQPTVFVLEDLHWVDSSSMSFFNDLVRSTASVPMVLLCQFRPDYRPTWGTLPNMVQLELPTLTPDQTSVLVGSILKTNALPPGLAELVYAKSDGNPFFIEEIIKSLMDNKSLVRGDDGWEVVGEVDKLRVSATLQELLFARIDRLDPDPKRALEMASVIGRSFPRRVLEEARKPENHLEASLEILSQQKLVIEGAFYPEREYSFRNALVQEVAYNSISRRQRSLYHERVAKATERVYADRLVEVIETLANHYYLSQNAEQAAIYLIQAGNKARDAYANQEALQLYEKALEVVDRASKTAISFLVAEGPKLPAEKAEGWRVEALLNHADICLLVGDGDRALEGYRSLLEMVGLKAHADVRQIADLHRRIAKVYEFKGDFATAFDWLDKGLEVLGSREIAERRLVGAQIYYAGAVVFHRQGQYEKAFDWARQALSIVEGTSALQEQAQCYGLLGAVARNEGKLDEAIEYRETALSLQERAGDVVAAAATYNNLGVAYYDLGQWDKALSYYEKALVVREKTGDIRAISGLTNNIGLIYLWRSQYDRAQQNFERALAASREAGFTYGEGMAHIDLGILWLRLGDLARAEESVGEGLRLLDQMQSKGYLSEALSRLAEVKLARGAAEEALSLGERAIEVAVQLKSRADFGIAACIVGRALAVQGDMTLAEQRFGESLAAMEEARNKHGMGNALVELGLLCERAGKEEERRRYMVRARDIFRSLGAEGDVAAVEGQL